MKIRIAILCALVAVICQTGVVNAVYQVVKPDIYNGKYVINDEVIEKRTENSKTYYVGNNKFRLEVSMNIVHYKDNYYDEREQWKDIDLTPDSNGNITKAPYILINSKGTYTFIDRKTGDSVIIKPTKIGDELVAEGDVNVVAMPEGVKLQRKLFSTSDPLNSEFDIDIHGNSIKVEANAVDDDGKHLPVNARIDNGKLTEKVSFIDGTIKFPVKVDPTLTVQPSSKDTYIDSSHSTTNYGGNDRFFVGVGYVGIIEFSLSGLPSGSVVTSATMSLYWAQNAGITGGEVVDCYRVLRTDWVESEATWNIFKTGNNWTTAGCNSNGNDYTTTHASSFTLPAPAVGINHFQDCDVKDMVIDSVSAGNDAIFKVRMADAGVIAVFLSKEHVTSANRPKLVIEYIPLLTVDSVSSSSVLGTIATTTGNITQAASNQTQVGTVYGTVSNVTTPAHAQIPPAGYANNVTNSGSYGNGTFDINLSGLAKGTQYYFRSFAGNSTYYSYGSELTFTTLDDPAITVLAASYVSTTTARLNAQVSDDGGQLCDIRFGYGTTSQPATLSGFAAYTNHTAWVNDTYSTGNTTYVNLSTLAIGTTYYFNAQIENDSGIGYGVEGSFTTETGMGVVTNFVAIPENNKVLLNWTKAPGASNTAIRYSTTTYPNTTADGTLIYSGLYSSYTHTGLNEGQSYYYSAWGLTSGVYSPDKATVLATTTAGVVPTGITVVTATTNKFSVLPSELGLSDFPLYDTGNWVADTFTVPRATFWVFVYLLLVLIIGMVIYIKASANNLLLTLFVVMVFLVVGSLPTPPLIPLWVTFAFVIFVIGVGFTMNRQP